MSAINRIGSPGPITRDDPSEGLAKAAKDRDGSAPAGSFEGLPLTNRHKAQAPGPRNPQVDQVAKLYEKQFLREMVKAMRGTVSFNDMDKPSMAENIYREGLDDQYVETWGNKGGIGLSDLIYQQIMERYFASPQGQSMKAQGALKLTNRDVSRVSQMRSAAGPGQVPLRIEIKPPALSGDGAGSTPSLLKAPWDARVVSRSLLDGKTSLILDHGSGLRSTLIFDGVAGASVESGAELKQGQDIGILSPEVRSFFWNLARSSEDGQKTAVGGI